MAARKKTSTAKTTKRAPRSRKKKAAAVQEPVVASESKSEPVVEGPPRVEAQAKQQPPPPEEMAPQVKETPRAQVDEVKEKRSQQRVDRLAQRQQKIAEARARGAAADAERERRQAAIAEERRNKVRERQARQQAMQLEQEAKAEVERKGDAVPAATEEESTTPALRVVKNDDSKKPIDLSEARRKKMETEKESLTVQFPEALAWKYQAMAERRNGITAIIQRQVVAAFEQKLQAQIRAACAASPAWIQANDAMHSVINEIIEQVEPTLPGGYAVDLIEPKDHTAVVKYNPEGVGKRMKLSTDEKG